MNAREQQVDPDAVRTIEAELEDATGHPVSHAEARAAVAGRPRRRGFMDSLSENSMLVAITFGTALVVGVIVSLIVGSWWVLAAAIVGHAIATLLVVGTIFWLFQEEEKPDPVTVARLQDEGVRDPERVVNDALREQRG